MDNALATELGMTREEFYDQLDCDLARAQKAAKQINPSPDKIFKEAQSIAPNKYK